MKEQLKNEIQKNLNQVRASLQRARGSQSTYKYLNEINEVKRKTWAKEIVDRNAESLKVTQENELMGYLNQALEAYDKAMVAARKRGEFLDVNDEKLTNAMRLIRELGNDLTDETASSINSQFIGDQSSLKALKGLYKKAGISHDGLIDTNMYADFERTWGNARSALYSEMELDGYVNSAGQAIAKIAKLEGLEFDPVIDKNMINSQDQIRGMSTEQVNSNWEEISKFMGNS